MNNYRIIDKASWPRGGMFDFYQKFVNPCFNMSVPVEGGSIRACAKGRGESFFLLSLYAIARAANLVPQLRQRVVGGGIVEFERIAVMTPIMTEQEMFRQIWCEYAPSYAEFAEDASAKVAAAKRDAPSQMEERGEDFICASCSPWVHFSSVTQADYAFDQAVPILAWGKLKDGIVPFSCKFSHSFVDGLHAARFFACVEYSFANPETLWLPAAPLAEMVPF